MKKTNLKKILFFFLETSSNESKTECSGKSIKTSKNLKKIIDQVRPFDVFLSLFVSQEIIREVHQTIPLSLKIGIPFDKTSIESRSSKKKFQQDEKQNRKMEKIEENFREMKFQLEQQNEQIEVLKEKIDSITKTPEVEQIEEIPPVEKPIVPKPKPFPEDFPIRNLSRTIWK